MIEKSKWNGIVIFPNNKTKSECIRETRTGSDFLFFTLKSSTGFYDFVTFNKDLVSMLEAGDEIIPIDFYPTQRSYVNQEGRKTWKISFTLNTCRIENGIKFTASGKSNPTNFNIQDKLNDMDVKFDSLDEFEKSLLNENKENDNG